MTSSMSSLPGAPVALLEAPSVLGLFPGGVQTLPEALLAAGLADALGAHRAGRVEPPDWSPRRDPETGVRNGRAIAGYSTALADGVAAIHATARFPLVLGGDCSILLGCLLALRRRTGRHGLLFLDGHADFYQPEAEPHGEVASMEVALATGHGPRWLTDLEGRRPLVHASDVVLFGRRDAEEAKLAGSRRVEDTEATILDLSAIRTHGVADRAAAAVRELTRPELAGLWIHLDVDVVDDALMPAVDYRLPGGLSWEELTTVLRLALASGGAVGLDVTIFNPTLDPDGAAARALATALEQALRPVRS
jgi:arginase